MRLLLHGLKDDLLLDEVLVLIGTDPSGAGTESRRILLVLMSLLHDVVIGVWAHDEEGGCGLLAGCFFVSDLIKMVVDHLAKINQSILLDLDLSVHINLYSRGMDDTQVTDEVFAILTDNHELRFPQLLVVRDLVVIAFALTDLEDTLGTIDRDLQILELLSIDGLKLHVKFVRGSTVGQRLKSAALEVNRDLKIRWAQFTKVDRAQLRVIDKLSETRVSGGFKAWRAALNLLLALIEFPSVSLYLVLKGVVTDTGSGIHNLLDKLRDFVGIYIEAEDEVTGDGGILVSGKVRIVELRDFVEVS